MSISSYVKKLNFICIAVVFVFFVGCSTFSVDSFARYNGFTRHVFSHDSFDIVGYLRGEGDVLHVYIEGDGKAWLSRSRPSTDPTPSAPVSFHLAAGDTHEAVLYLARPCQFVKGDELRNCITSFWTSARFSEPVIRDMNSALDSAKRMAGARRLKLVGYSGGGAVALLVAVRRDDVDSVVTVAGNLDHAFWTRLHAISPLRDSLNPADIALELQELRQMHVVSKDDSIIPPSVIESYVSKMSDSRCVQVVVVEGVEHTGDWTFVLPLIMADKYGN